MSGKCQQNCPEFIFHVQKMSGKYPENDQNCCPEFFHVQKTGQILDMKTIPEKFSGHIPDMQKIWTNSGQINWTNSGHEKFQKTRKNSGHIPDNISKKMQIVQNWCL